MGQALLETGKTTLAKTPSRLPPAMLTAGETPLYETRPVWLPLLFKPALLIILGIVIAGSLPGPVMTIGLLQELDIARLAGGIIRWTGIIIVLLGGLGGLFRLGRCLSTIYSLTDRRIMTQSGLVSRSYVDCSLDKIHSTYLTISILGRLLDYGTLRIVTGDRSDTDILWRDIRAPVLAHRAVNEAIKQFAQGEVRQ